jgi:hypothetical protein
VPRGFGRLPGLTSASGGAERLSSKVILLVESLFLYSYGIRRAVINEAEAGSVR